MRIPALTAACTLATFAVHALEAAATNPGQSDNASLRMELESKVLALTTVVNSMNTCTAKQGFFNPTAGGADADGCTFAGMSEAKWMYVDIATNGGNDLPLDVNIPAGTYTSTAPSRHAAMTRMQIVGDKPSCPDKVLFTGSNTNSNIFGPQVETGEDTIDNSARPEVVQMPTCANGYHAILRVKDVSDNDAGDVFSLEGRFHFLIVPGTAE